MTIKKLPSTERPYEKAQMYGIENLSNSELLAIIIKTGTKEKTSVQLAQEILSIESKNKENIQFLQDISLEELTKIKGIGIVKAIQIKAVCEMAKRISKPLNANKVQIRSSASVANLLMNEMKYEKREKVKVLVLNTKNVLIKIIDVSYGGTNSAIIEPKDILAEFQIRTLAMNFWATIEHSLNYKYKQHIPKEIQDKLKEAADSAFNLDEQMLEIKDEIKDAQRLFEVKSDIITNIMNNIMTLMSLGKAAEASRYQVMLNKLVDEGEVWELNSLLDSIKKDIVRYKDNE